MLHKDVLFYGQACQHSHRALRLLGDRPFIGVDVATCHPSALPRWLDRVPTLVLRDTTVLTEQMLFTYLEQHTAAAGVAGAAATAAEEVSPLPFCEEYSGSAYSDRYTFIGYGDNADPQSSSMPAPRQYAFIGEQHRIETPPDDGKSTTSSAALASSAQTGGGGVSIDTLMARRSAELRV
jgi:hypothetical protein